MIVLRPKYLMIGGGIIFLLIMVSLAQEMNRRWQYQSEVDQLEKSAAQLQKNVVELENLNTYFRTPEYQERQAREKLNYRAPGEKVVLIPQNDSAAQASRAVVPAAAPAAVPWLWWKIFFVDQ